MTVVSKWIPHRDDSVSVESQELHERSSIESSEDSGEKRKHTKDESTRD